MYVYAWKLYICEVFHEPVCTHPSSHFFVIYSTSATSCSIVARAVALSAVDIMNLYVRISDQVSYYIL